MRPQIENIEARSAETIFQALRDRIPRYLREWDDYNESDPGIALLQLFAVVGEGRSEEHTSELQSLMRISYAVFCLTKKTVKHTAENQESQTTAEVSRIKNKQN